MWPGKSTDIKDHVKGCTHIAMFAVLQKLPEEDYVHQ